LSDPALQPKVIDGAPGFLAADGLTPGQEIRLAVGEASGFEWTPLAGRKEFKVTLYPGNNEPSMRLPGPVLVRVTPRDPDHLDLFLPGTSPPDPSPDVVVTVRDRHDNRVPVNTSVTVSCGGTQTTVHLNEGTGRARLPASTPRPVPAEIDGDDLCPGRWRSNWSLPSGDANLYFGDMHAHDMNSSAEGYTADVYRWAIEDKRLDFLSVPVQTHAYLDNENWVIAKQLAETFLEEGRFVTFLSFEWQHSHYGDKVIHYLSGDQPYLPIDDKRYASPRALYEALRGTDAFIISHHPGYALDRHVPGTDWDAVETDVDRLVEIWSMHGSSEGLEPGDRPLRPPRREEGMLAGLKKGLRFGLVAGSDTHSGRPGGSAKEPRPYWGGLCAVWAETLARRALFDAFMARRTYALTGPRIALRFSINGSPMGSEIPAVETMRLHAEAWAPAPIAAIQFVCDGVLLHEEQPDALDARADVEAPRPPGAAPSFIYCRVVQEDGHLAVSSPIWVG
jgi:hypothetical protein